MAGALELARTSDRPLDILVNMSGRGDKDLATVLRYQAEQADREPMRAAHAANAADAAGKVGAAVMTAVGGTDGR